LSDLREPLRLRDFRAADAPQVNRVALAAFNQFKAHYSDWPAMAASVARMATLADHGEIIVAERDDRIIGAVAYVPPVCRSRHVSTSHGRSSACSWLIPTVGVWAPVGH